MENAGDSFRINKSLLENGLFEEISLSPARGTYRKGHVDLDGPVDWPDGSKVTMIPAPVGLGLNEADWPDSPEAREALLARLDGIEPLELSPEDEAEIGMARESVRGASLRSVRQQMGLDS